MQGLEATPAAAGHDRDSDTKASLASISELLSGLIGGETAHRGLDRVMVFALDVEQGALVVAARSPAVSLEQTARGLVSLGAPRGPIARCAICSEELSIDVGNTAMPDVDRGLLTSLGAKIKLLPLLGRRGLRCREELNCLRRECPAYALNDKRCWTIEGTLCRNGTPVLPEHKLEVCLRCPAFGVMGVLAIGGVSEADMSILNTGALIRLADHIGALIEANLTAKALSRLNAELESRVDAARREITAKNELLLRSERLAVMGKLAAGLAHEINNPLGVISACVQSLLLDSGGAEEASRPLEIISNEVGRISTLVRGLLDLSREQPLNLVETDISALVEQSLELVSPEARNAGVEVRFRGKVPAANATVDRSQLQQVVMNLALNAIQAMRTGGILEVSVIMTDHVPGRRGSVEINLADTGPGMPQEVLEQVFDPFFTTKQDSGGIGLGLSISQSIVEKHGGTVVAKSELGEGTVFTVRLPTKDMS